LMEAAAATKGRGVIVEMARWKGRSTTWLAAGARLARRGDRRIRRGPRQVFNYRDRRWRTCSAEIGVAVWPHAWRIYVRIAAI
jgi:hypothetical protein